MLEGLKRTWWKTTVSSEVRSRHQNLAKDFRALVTKKIFPQSPDEVLDVGSGSGAGSVALRDVYSASLITAIDNAENWQSGVYLRKKPPSVINFLPVSTDDFSRSHKGQFDLTVAAQISISLPFSIIYPWARKAEFYGATMLSIVSMLREHGTLALSWPKNDAFTIDNIIHDNLRMDQLFSTRQSFKGETDNWIIWRDFSIGEYENFANKPDMFLTSFAKNSPDLDPYGLFDEF